jgi:hypothetical protein
MGYQREYYRGRRERRNPFGDMNLAQLGKVYADIPIDAMQTAMTDLNEEYIRNRDLQDKYESALASAEVMAGDDVKKQQYIQSLRDKVDQFTQDTDGAYETGDNFVRGLAKDVGNNEWLYKAMQNKQKFDEGEAAYKEDMRRGLNPQYFKPENFTTAGMDADGNSTLNDYDYYIGKGVDMDPTMQTFFADLKANKSTYIDDFMNITTNTGVSSERVQQVVEEGFQGLKQTDAYQQDLQNRRAQAQYTGVPFDEAAYDAQRKQEFAAVGERFVYNQKDRNPNRALFNAQLAAKRKAGSTGGGNTTEWRSNATSGMRSAKDKDMLFNDSFSWNVQKSSTNPTYRDTDPVKRKFDGNIVVLGNDRKSGKRMKAGSYDDTFNTMSTGELVVTPFVVGHNPQYNAELINQAFAAKGLDFKYNVARQKEFKDEMPYEGKISGVIGIGGGRWGDVENFTPQTLTLNYGKTANGEDIIGTAQYIIKDGEPIFVESRTQSVYNLVDDDGAPTGEQILSNVSPDIAAKAGFGEDLGWSSLTLDSSGMENNNGRNLEVSMNRLAMFSRMTTGPMKQESLNAYKDMKVILDKVKSNKPLTGLEKARVQGIDRRLMPIVFENTSFEQGTKDDASKAVNPMN